MSQFEPIDEIPESTRRILSIEILEDLSDSQLVAAVSRSHIPGTQFLPLAAILSEVVSDVIGSLSSESTRAHQELINVVNGMCEAVGVPSPFGPKTEVDSSDVERTLEGLSQFLDKSGDNPGK